MRTTRCFARMLRALACCTAAAALAQAPIQPPPHPFGLPVPPQAPRNLEWAQLPGAGHDIGAGRGAVWAIGTDSATDGYGIYRWNGSSWDRMPGGGVRIAVDAKGNAWVVTASHGIQRYDGQKFVAVAGKATDIGVGGDGSVWAIGADPVGNDYGIYRLVNGSWQKMPGAGVRIDVDVHGNAWVVNSSHQIQVWNGSAWKQVAGAATDIGIGKWEGSVFVVDPAGRILKWSNGGWALVPGGLVNISVDEHGIPWGTNANNQLWAAYIRPAPTSSFGSAGKPTTIAAAAPVNAQAPSYPNWNYPMDRPCPTATYAVPFGVTYVRITATGGGGLGGDAQNVIATLAGAAGVSTGHPDQSGPSPGWANISAGTGGRGAKVSAIFPVVPLQTLYVVAGLNAVDAERANQGDDTLSYPGGGRGYQPGGGLSMVSTSQPTRASNDSNTCVARLNSLLVVAGGGGGAGATGGSGSGGNGGDAGMANQNGKAGAEGGGGHYSGGGASGGTLTVGGTEGTHNGCGSDGRYAGSYLRGGDTSGDGGSGGGGYYGGGAGGSGDCILETGSGGGGGGSSYVAKAAIGTTSAIALQYDAGVVIEPVQPQ